MLGMRIGSLAVITQRYQDRATGRELVSRGVDTARRAAGL